MHLLATDVILAVRNPEGAARLAAWLQGRAETGLFLSVLTLGDIERDAHALAPAPAPDLRAWLDRTTRLFADRLLPFDAEAARLWGRLSPAPGLSGTDLMIAATALARGATLVTAKAEAFRPTGVAVESPV